MNNSFGSLFRITTFGESHGEALGVTIDGMPAGLAIISALSVRMQVSLCVIWLRQVRRQMLCLWTRPVQAVINASSQALSLLLPTELSISPAIPKPSSVTCATSSLTATRSKKCDPLICFPLHSIVNVSCVSHALSTTKFACGE